MEGVDLRVSRDDQTTGNQRSSWRGWQGIVAGPLPPPPQPPKVENAIRTHLSAGKGILNVAALVGAGSGTVRRVKREMAQELQLAA